MAVLIDYREVLELLKNNAGDLHPGIEQELCEVVKVMVFQYFSRYSSTSCVQLESNLAYLLDVNTGNLQEHWENSDVAMLASLMIVQITQTFLPGFNSHRAEDCSAIQDISVHRPDSVVFKLEIDPESFQRFAKSPVP